MMLCTNAMRVKEVSFTSVEVPRHLADKGGVQTPLWDQTPFSHCGQTKQTMMGKAKLQKLCAGIRHMGMRSERCLVLVTLLGMGVLSFFFLFFFLPWGLR